MCNPDDKLFFAGEAFWQIRGSAAHQLQRAMLERPKLRSLQTRNRSRWIGPSPQESGAGSENPFSGTPTLQRANQQVECHHEPVEIGAQRRKSRMVGRGNDKL